MSSLIDADGRLNLCTKPEEEVQKTLEGLSDEDCKKIRQLWIVDCKLHKFPANVEKMTNLFGLYVSGHNNYCHVIPNLTSLTNLVYFTIPDIGTIPKGFKSTFDHPSTQKMLKFISEHKYEEDPVYIKPKPASPVK